MPHNSLPPFSAPFQLLSQRQEYDGKHTDLAIGRAGFAGVKKSRSASVSLMEPWRSDSLSLSLHLSLREMGLRTPTSHSERIGA